MAWSRCCCRHYPNPRFSQILLLTPLIRVGARVSALLCSPRIPLTPQEHRRTSEEAHLCGRRIVRTDRSRGARGHDEWGDCPERRYTAAGVVVLGDPEPRWETAHRLGPAVAGLGPYADHPDDPCDQVHLRAARLEGGQVLDRLPEL